MGSNFGEGWKVQKHLGKDAAAPCQSSDSSKAGLGSCLLPTAATPMPPCLLRRATTPFPCANSAAYLTTDKLGTRSHVEFKNKTSKRSLCSLKKPKQITPKSKHLPGLARSTALPEAESAGEEAVPTSCREWERGTRNRGQDGNHRTPPLPIKKGEQHSAWKWHLQTKDDYRHIKGGSPSSTTRLNIMHMRSSSKPLSWGACSPTVPEPPRHLVCRLQSHLDPGHINDLRSTGGK